MRLVKENAKKSSEQARFGLGLNRTGRSLRLRGLSRRDAKRDGLDATAEDDLRGDA